MNSMVEIKRHYDDYGNVVKMDLYVNQRYMASAKKNAQVYGVRRKRKPGTAVTLFVRPITHELHETEIKSMDHVMKYFGKYLKWLGSNIWVEGQNMMNGKFEG
jgi:hypothetical protein